MDGNSQLYVVQELTDVYQMWVNSNTSLIADKIFPSVPVPGEMFYAWYADTSHLAIPNSTARIGSGKAPMVKYGQKTQLKGPLVEKTLGIRLDERDYKFASSVTNIENRTVERLASQMALNDESYLANTILSDTTQLTHNTALSGGAQWSDHGNSNPFTDLTTSITQLSNYSPIPPNTIWFSNETWLQIVNHPDFLARLGLAQDRVMNEAKFVGLLAPYGIEKVYIGKAKYKPGNVNQATTNASVWPKHCWLGYITDSPAQDEINGGYKFYLDGQRKVTREYINNPPCNEIINRDYYEYLLLSPDVYFLIQNVIA